MIRNLFDFDMTDKETIAFDPESEALWHVYTGNDMDALYFIAPKGIDADEEARRSMFKRFGKRYPRIVEVADESFLLTEIAEEA